MKHILTILIVAAAVLPACKSTKNERYVKAAAPDAKAELYISPDDHRYVEGGMNREIIYYSERNERTYVVDEESGRILKTFEGTMPKVKVIEPARTDEDMGCGCGEEMGCGDDMACGCGDEEKKKDSGCGE
jgi:hypothetical protein